MLELTVFDGERDVVLKLEHSLLSVSKWESKHKKPFMTKDQKLPTEMVDYFQCMIVSPEGSEDLIYALEPEQLDEVTNYISDPMTASSVPKDNKMPSPETVTSELVYYWMVALKIPFEAETWHINRLMMLISITNFKNQPPKKQKASEMLSKFREANAARKAQYGTTG